MTIKEKRDIKRKLNVINYAKKIGSVASVDDNSKITTEIQN